MWNDAETTEDLLNFKVIADTAAKLIIESSSQPVSIGVSGSWGTGKSSLVKMIGKSLKDHEDKSIKDSEDKSIKDGEDKSIKDDKGKFLFVDFNAWLYQGYDEARNALLQMVGEAISKEANLRKNNSALKDKVKDYYNSINWLKTLSGAGAVAIDGGAVSALLLAASFMKNEDESAGGTDGLLNHLKKLPKAIASFQKGSDDNKELSIPEEISAFRDLFESILLDLNVTLVIQVDDLDRCLPKTTISTLEAMRLLLFMQNTAFIIAADEQMIRSAVQAHFGEITLNEELVTSYFDKLIQIPLRVPRLGVNEVKGYLILLLAERARKVNRISQEQERKGRENIIKKIQTSWANPITLKALKESYEKASKSLSEEFELAISTAEILTTSKQIAGNPRVIKRFLNSLVIRESIAKAQNMSIPFDQIVKVLLLERCGDPKSFDFLIESIGLSKDGKLNFLKKLEEGIDYSDANLSSEQQVWAKNSFIKGWLELKPNLSDVDLRPLLFISRNNVIQFPDLDELSEAGNEAFNAILVAKHFKFTEKIVENIGLQEAAKILGELFKNAKSKKYIGKLIKKMIHLTSIKQDLEEQMAEYLEEIPTSKLDVSIIPLLKDKQCYKKLLEKWAEDNGTSSRVRNAIEN